MPKTAFITGIAGQDGADLTRCLLAGGYEVHGLMSPDACSGAPMDALAQLDALGLVADDIKLHIGDVTDTDTLDRLIEQIQPDEIYNLAGRAA